MRIGRLISVGIAVVIITIWSFPALGEVTVDPFGILVALEGDNAADQEMTLTNDGDSDVAFTIELVEPEQDQQQHPGPRRDDLGDIIAGLEIGQGIWAGLAWDGELMWGVDFERQIIVGVDPEHGEIDREVEIGRGCTGMCWDGEAFWLGSIESRELYRIDRNGDELGGFQLPEGEGEGAFGVAWDGEYLWYGRAGGDGNLYQITADGDQVRQVDCGNVEGSEFPSLVWVPEHNEGHMWMLACGEEAIIYQLNVEEDRAEVVQSTRIEHMETYGISHDGVNLWYQSFDSGWFIMDDGVDEPVWIAVDPQEGIIQGNDEAAVTFTFSAQDMEEGTYEMLIVIELEEENRWRDDPEEPLIEISAVMSVDTEVCTVAGTVVDPANNDEAISGARADIDRYLVSRFSDDRGGYALERLPLGVYEFTFTATDYLPHVEEIALDEGGEVEMNVELLHSTCTPSVADFDIWVEPDEEQVIEFEVSNRGNGPLNYTVERRFIGDDDWDPWDLREDFNIEDEVDDNLINGVCFAEGNFFVSGGNNSEEINRIYVINPEGEIINQFNQFNESRYGMRDLTWDGDLIWGADVTDDGNILFGFNTEGELVETIEGNAESYRSLTWDPDGEVFWSADITSNNIFATNRNGEVVRTIDRPRDVLIYGLAYWPDDPDGYQLYVFARCDETDLTVNKINIESGEATVAAELVVEGGHPGGINITSGFDPNNWVFAGIVLNPDRLMIWQLAALSTWFLIEPEEGMIEADNIEEFTLTLNAAGRQINDVLEGELVYHHDGVGGETILPVMMTVYDEEQPQPPSRFGLLMPEDNVTVGADDDVNFAWQLSTDPNPDDVVGYWLWFHPEEEENVFYMYDLEDTTFVLRPDTLFDCGCRSVQVNWWVVAHSGTDTTASNERFTFWAQGSGVDGDDTGLPEEFAIQAVYPNPFNARASISYSLDRASRTQLKVFDFTGREVAVIDCGQQAAGWYRTTIDASMWPCGVYIVRLTAGSEVRTAKLLCIK